MIPFPEALDNTIISTFAACPQKAFRTYFEHWKPKNDSIHLHAGKAFASALEASRTAYFANGATPEDAYALGQEKLTEEYGDFQAPEGSAKSLDRMSGALEYYFKHYPFQEQGVTPVTFANGRLGIEFSFAEPLDILHPVTGNPILYTGRADMIAKRQAMTFIYDEKTTSSLGPSWARQWDLSSQFTGYSWAAQRISLPVHGIIIRGVSILKTKYDTMEVITYRPQWEIDRWYEQTFDRVRRMIQAWEEMNWEYNLGHSCIEYGGCTLTKICKSKDPETWLPMYFEKRVWDPLLREEIRNDATT